MMGIGYRVRQWAGAVAALLLAGCTTLAAPSAPHRGLVSAADPRAAAAGTEILRKGGNATDAAIATMLALGIVEPQSSGIGGGGFLVRARPDGEVETIDGREAAPAAARPDWFTGADGQPIPFDKAVQSGLSVGVPGNIALAAQAHAQFGHLPWRDLFRPAIRLASHGWRLSRRGHSFLADEKATGARDAEARALYYRPDGTAREEGELLRNREAAATLKVLARNGPRAFYSGVFAHDLAGKVRADTPRPKAMVPADLAAYRAVNRAPVCGFYRLYRICGMGPPSSGATTVLAILGQLERFDLAALGSQSPVFWHLFAESQRLAYADRDRFLADPDHIAVPVLQLIEPAYLAKRSALIDPARAMDHVEPGLDLPPPDGMDAPEHGTSHFVVIDAGGVAVSYTSTIEGPFGSGLMVGGFYLNNELTDFSFVARKQGRAVANRVEPGKRPRSSMAPTVVYGPDGRLFMAVGAAGGATIPVQVAKILLAVIDLHMPLDAAIALPVLFSPTDTVSLEPGTALEAMAPALRAMGHSVKIRAMPLKANAAILSGARWEGAADPRSEGVALTP